MLIFPSFLLEDVYQAMTANTETVTAPKISQEPCGRLVVCLFLLLTGGRVIFNVGNDSPTLTGAKVTFTIDLEFPHNQRVQPNGDVVWAEDCVINGKTPFTHTHRWHYSLYTQGTRLFCIFTQHGWRCPSVNSNSWVVGVLVSSLFFNTGNI